MVEKIVDSIIQIECWLNLYWTTFSVSYS